MQNKEKQLKTGFSNTDRLKAKIVLGQAVAHDFEKAIVESGLTMELIALMAYYYADDIQELAHPENKTYVSPDLLAEIYEEIECSIIPSSPSFRQVDGITGLSVEVYHDTITYNDVTYSFTINWVGVQGDEGEWSQPYNVEVKQ